MQRLMTLPQETDREPGFACSPRYGVYRGNKVIEWFEGEHFTFTFATPMEWREDRASKGFLIGGRRFCISPQILTKLQNATLTLVEIDVSGNDNPSRIRQFLIAR